MKRSQSRCTDWAINIRLLVMMALLTLLAIAGAAHAQNGAADPAAESSEPDTVILVAAPNLVDPQFRQTVIVVTPVEGGRHIGVILNRPTRRSLSSLFPEHAPSRAVTEPVYFGGPMSRTAVFAVARGEQSPQAGIVPLLRNLYLALTVTLVDDIIEHRPNDARYYIGNVQWKPGELRDELRRRVWNVLNADPSVVLTDEPDRLWEKLSRMARSRMTQAPTEPALPRPHRVRA